MDYGFLRVAAAVPNLKVANCQYNAQRITELIEKANEENAQIIVFPELSITAYTCGDLFHQQLLIDASYKELVNILKNTKDKDIISILGMPVKLDNQLFNCAVVIGKGRILGIVPKTYIPGYSEFYEERWFSPGNKAISESLCLCGQETLFGTDLIFQAAGNLKFSFGIEICEDLWVPVSPSAKQAMAGALVIFNLSSSNEVIGKHEYREELIRQQSGKCMAGYVYASSGIDESTTDVVFGGQAMICENGSTLKSSERFSLKAQLIYSDIDVERLCSDRAKNTSFMEYGSLKKFRKVDFELRDIKRNTVMRPLPSHPFVPADLNIRDKRCQEIFSIQTCGLSKRLRHTNMLKAVIGISGGLDSTLALLVTVKAFDMLSIPRENIISVTMPGFGTTDATYQNAIELMKSMGVSIKEIDIKPSCLQHFIDIGHDEKIHDTTYENVQARERTQILMDIANKIGGLVIGTGDLSELALGWCTYNGDHMSMYAVNSSIPKTLVKFLVNWVGDNIVDETTKNILQKILNTPISPELLPPDPSGQINQKTEDIIGPYELHDFFLYHIIRYGAPPKKVLFLAEQAFFGKYKKEEMKSWLKVFLKRFFSQQFKRSCLPDGPKVGTISLSPRGDFRMPSDADAFLWLNEL